MGKLENQSEIKVRNRKPKTNIRTNQLKMMLLELPPLTHFAELLHTSLPTVSYKIPSV
jgi:hypothetical protein